MGSQISEAYKASLLEFLDVRANDIEYKRRKHSLSPVDHHHHQNNQSHNVADSTTAMSYTSDQINKLEQLVEDLLEYRNSINQPGDKIENIEGLASLEILSQQNE